MNIIFLLFLHAISAAIGAGFGLAIREWFLNPDYWAAFGNFIPFGIIPVLILLVVWGFAMAFFCVKPLSGDFAPEAEDKASQHVIGSLCFTQLAAAIAIQASAYPLDMASPMSFLWVIPIIAIGYAYYSTWRFPAN